MHSYCLLVQEVGLGQLKFEQIGYKSWIFLAIQNAVFPRSEEENYPDWIYAGPVK